MTNVLALDGLSADKPLLSQYLSPEGFSIKLGARPTDSAVIIVQNIAPCEILSRCPPTGGLQNVARFEGIFLALDFAEDNKGMTATLGVISMAHDNFNKLRTHIKFNGQLSVRP